MIDGMDIKVQSLLEPPSQPGISGWDLVCHDADRGPAVYLFESVKDRAQVGLVRGRVTHVINGEHDDRFNAGLTDPLRSRQLGELAGDVVRIEEGIKVSQSICVLGSQWSGHAGENATDQQPGQERLAENDRTMHDNPRGHVL